LGHAISNLSIVDRTCCNRPIGFFNNIKSAGSVRNFLLLDVSISHRATSKKAYDTWGTLAGLNAGVISSSFVSGIITADPYAQGSVKIGALVAGNIGVIQNSHTNVQITIPAESNYLEVAGIAGTNSGTIDQSDAIGPINISNHGVVYAGGITGTNSGIISHSHASANITAAIGTVGGLVGANQGMIQTSYATGSVSIATDRSGQYCDSASAGGVVGTASAGSIIENTYALGAVESSGEYGCSGGLAGDFTGFEGVIRTSFAIGEVSGSGKIGGLIGRGVQLGNKKKPPAIQYGYWDIDTTRAKRGIGSTRHGEKFGVIGLTDTQLKAGLPAGFDPAVWGQSASINSGYPYLLANPPPQ
jgi:hypothetical protein